MTDAIDPTTHDPAHLERFKERRGEAGVGAVLCHALYLVNLAGPNEVFFIGHYSVPSISFSSLCACLDAM